MKNLVNNYKEYHKLWKKYKADKMQLSHKICDIGTKEKKNEIIKIIKIQWHKIRT